MNTELLSRISTENFSIPPASRLLLVEDEPTMRVFLEGVLRKKGYAVTSASNVAEAQQAVLSQGPASFDCVVTDYLMPEQTGIDLLRWLQGMDPCLATIVITAESEKKIVADSLREGACDFLEKPVSAKNLCAAAQKAVAATQQKRRQALAEASVKEVGRVQHLMLDTDTDQRMNKPEIDMFFRPKSEAGGDFLNHFGLGENHFLLLTDVSGHDLKAAFISAYFQGIVRGMLESGSQVSQVFAFFNSFLLREWNLENASSKSGAVSVSLAVSAVLIEPRHGRATVLVSGSPLPVYVSEDGRARVVGEAGSAPLGWFAENSVKLTRVPVTDGGAFFLWTDGLESFAEEQQISAAGLATVLLLAKHGLRTEPDLCSAADDILVGRAALPTKNENADGFLPLIFESYRGDQGREIDELQVYWTKSLLFCLPELSPENTFNLILASREAVLNALDHGCEKRADRSATFSVTYCPTQQLIRVVVCDPGSGHRFDLAAHQQNAGDGLIDEHRGLIMIHNLASKVVSEQNGATVVMDFFLDNEAKM